MTYSPSVSRTNSKTFPRVVKKQSGYPLFKVLVYPQSHCALSKYLNIGFHIYRLESELIVLLSKFQLKAHKNNFSISKTENLHVSPLDKKLLFPQHL